MAQPVGETVSKLALAVAQVEVIVSVAPQKPPDALICLDLLSELLAIVESEPKEVILPSQRKAEDALQALLLLGAGQPVRRLASTALVRLIEKGDSISLYSRSSSLQGWLAEKSEIKKFEPITALIGAAQCLGALYRAFGKKLSSGFLETTSIVAKLVKLPDASVRQAAMQLLQDALHGLGSGLANVAYAEALKVIQKSGTSDKAASVREVAAGCTREFALSGAPGLSAGGLESCAALCVKALEDPAQSVRDGFGAALGALLALGLNPEAQIPPSKGKGSSTPPKSMEGGLQKYLIVPFAKGPGPKVKDIRIGITIAWVAFLQRMHLTYGHSDFELQNYGMQALAMLAPSPKAASDPHAVACVLYIIRVGVVEQMGESAQKDLLKQLTKQLSSAECSPSMLAVVLRIISHLLVTLGEITFDARSALDSALLDLLSHGSAAVRVEAALTLRSLAEVDPVCVNNLMSCGLTTLLAMLDILALEKGDRLKTDLDMLHGQSAMLAALLVGSAKLLLGIPLRLPSAILDLGRKMIFQLGRKSIEAKEAGWTLVGAFVLSMPTEALEEYEHELVFLWMVDFGDRAENQLKKAEANLAAELEGWSAAVDALRAFIKSYVAPRLSASRNTGLVKAIIGFLSRALLYLSSPLLQQAPTAAKAAVDKFTLNTLRAFQAVPDPALYKSDHSALVTICMQPFKDASSCVASSCLRRLLDQRDAHLGPWVSGRDSFLDELREFEGDSDGLLPSVWDSELTVFPESLPLTTQLVDEMLLCLGALFAAQEMKSRLQIIDVIQNSARAGKNKNWHAANMTNICATLVTGLKVAISIRAQLPDAQVLQQLQTIFQGVLAEDGSLVAQRRAAAEGLGALARLGSDVYSSRLTRSLLADLAAVQECSHKASIALALGCIHRNVGGMALSALVPATVQALCTLTKDTRDSLHIWSLHALCLTADAAGLSFVPHVGGSLSVAMDLLLFQDQAAAELYESIGRLLNVIVAVLGPELSPGSALFARCKSVVAEISTSEEPAALLECILYTQQLVLFAPQALPVHTHVQTLRPILSSRQPSLRQAAVATLRHLTERDSGSVVKERIEEDLFAMLDKETDLKIISTIRLTLERLLEASCPSFPSRWLQLSRSVVLTTTVTRSGAGHLGESQGSEVHDGISYDDDDGMIAVDRKSGKPESRISEADQPRYPTRVFAAECLSRIPHAVGNDSRHFDLLRAKEHQAGSHVGDQDWLVLHLGELVTVAFQVATGALESLRPLGVALLATIVEKFGRTVDPEFKDLLLLEQYQAQVVSAIRTALEPSAGALLIGAGTRLAARFITSGMAAGDRSVLQRVVGLLSHPLNKWDDLNFPEHAEWVGVKVQLGLLEAHAAVWNYSFALCKEGSPGHLDRQILGPLMKGNATFLGPRWFDVLRDNVALALNLAAKPKPRYYASITGIQSGAIAAVVQPSLDEVCPIILQALSVGATPARILNSAHGKQEEERDDDEYGIVAASTGLGLEAAQFAVLWSAALALLLLRVRGGRKGRTSAVLNSMPSLTKKILWGSSPASASEINVALQVLGSLCSKGFYRDEMLSLELCEELLKVLVSASFHKNYWPPAAVLNIVHRILSFAPDTYLQHYSLSFVAAEICMGYGHQVANDVSTSELDELASGILTSALQSILIIVSRANLEVQASLTPSLLEWGVHVVTLLPYRGDLFRSALNFLARLTAVATESSSGGEIVALERMREVLAAGVESLARFLDALIEQAGSSDHEQLPQLLGLIAAMASSIPGSETGELSGLGLAAQSRAVGCLRQALSSPVLSTQMSALQTLRTLCQAGTLGQNSVWALTLIRLLGVAITGSVYTTIRTKLTTATAEVVGESLKVLVLLHSLVQGDEAQRQVLHLLLPIMIAVSSVSADGNSQEVTTLTTVAVKLVTHLASVPTYAAQFKTVLAELPLESRQRLQAIIRASVGQSSAAPPATSSAPAAMQPPPIVTKGLLPPPGDTQVPKGQSMPKNLPSPASEEEGDSDYDWDDFQESGTSGAENSAEVAPGPTPTEKAD